MFKSNYHNGAVDSFFGNTRKWLIFGGFGMISVDSISLNWYNCSYLEPYKEQLYHHEKATSETRSASIPFAHRENCDVGTVEGSLGNNRNDDCLPTVESVGVFDKLFAQWEVLYAEGDPGVQRARIVVAPFGMVLPVWEPGSDS